MAKSCICTCNQTKNISVPPQRFFASAAPDQGSSVVVAVVAVVVVVVVVVVDIGECLGNQYLMVFILKKFLRDEAP